MLESRADATRGCVLQVYMVGDPVQLPATVMSKRAVQANFQRSLFKRLQDAGYPVHILQVQYRMNPIISSFASQTFYDGRIEDGPDVKEQTERPFHKHAALGPLTFLNVDGKEETPAGSSSICNHAECDMVLALIQCLATQVLPFQQVPGDLLGACMSVLLLCKPPHCLANAALRSTCCAVRPFVFTYVHVYNAAAEP